MLPATTRFCSKHILKYYGQRNISKVSSLPNSYGISKEQTKILDLQEHCNLSDNNKWIHTNMFNSKNRTFSTIQTEVKRSPNDIKFASDNESKEFMAVFSDFVWDLNMTDRYSDDPLNTERFTKILQYCIPNGDKARGLAVVAAYRMLEKPENLTPENIRLAYVMGWCVEMIHGSFLMIRDVMDQAEMRRGTLCWHLKDDVGVRASNDACILKHGTYSILEQYFKDHPCYIPTMELFHDITLKTATGLALEKICSQDRKPNLDLFTMDRYNAIVKYKTAYYSFYLPVGLGLYLCNIYDPEVHRQAKNIQFEICHFYQVQKDFLNCFGDPSMTGKVDSDIQNGKFSWLATVALQRVTPARKQVMKEYYGNSDPNAVKIIRNLYEEFGLPTAYAIYEEETSNLIRTHIQQMTKGLPHDLFFNIMNKLCKKENR